MSDERIILGRYRLDERLAAGGTAEVWRARDLQLERDVAVKLLHPHLLPDSVSRARLVAEARAAASLDHPAIVAVYDVDAEGETPALVMEYVAGRSLAVRLAADGPLPPDEVARIGAEVAEALYFAHRRGIVHRDVKPGNILIEPDGRARLVDFGIAHSLAVGAERLTMTGTVIGTLRSMAPEQLLGERITPRTDLYSLGTVLYEALVGRPPYDESSPVALARAQVAGPPPLPGQPDSLAAVVLACLQAEVTRRPIHAGAVAAALRAWLAGDEAPALGITARAEDIDTGAQTMIHAQPALEPAADVPAPAAVSDPPQRRVAVIRRGTAVPLGLVAVALGVLLVAAIASGMFRPNMGVTDAASPTPLATATAAPAATPAPTPTPGFDLGALPPPVADEVRKWWEDCGTEGEPPPVDLSGMNKKDAEDALEPYREECSEGD